MIVPMLAKSATRLPSGKDYIYEIKLDGQRTVVHVDNRRLLLQTRNQLNVTAKYPELSQIAKRLDCKSAVIDGEIVALEDGIPSFELLQQRMSLQDLRLLNALTQSVPVIYYAFDVLAVDGKSLLRIPLLERKKTLQKILKPDGTIKVLPFFDSREFTIEKARQFGYEGIVAKKRDSFYYPGQRTDCWFKYKFQSVDSFVICGWLEGGRSKNFGSLIVGKYRGDVLQHTGRVGTGFNDDAIRMLMTKFEKLHSKQCPFPRSPERTAHWLRPRLVAEVKFREWTKAGILRAPVFLGLRTDLKPADCRFED